MIMEFRKKRHTSYNCNGKVSHSWNGQLIPNQIFLTLEIIQRFIVLFRVIAQVKRQLELITF